MSERACGLALFVPHQTHAVARRRKRSSSGLPRFPIDTQPSHFEIEVRVRYAECDPMNVAHHSVYPIWMELARTEMLRQRGVAYRTLEERGVFFVVARLSLRYKRPARYDDLLRIRVTLHPSAGVKVEHEYEIFRGDELLATAETTLVCVDKNGKLQAVPTGTL